MKEEEKKEQYIVLFERKLRPQSMRVGLACDGNVFNSFEKAVEVCSDYMSQRGSIKTYYVAKLQAKVTHIAAPVQITPL